jgi:hypothetical protein
MLIHTFHIRSQMLIYPIITTAIIIKANYYDESLCSLFHNHLALPPVKRTGEAEQLSVHTVDAYLITRVMIPGSINAHFGVDIQRNFRAAWRPPGYRVGRVIHFVVPRSRSPNVSLGVNLGCTSSEVVVGLFIFKHQYIAINDWEKKIHQETLVMESCLQLKQPGRFSQ